MGLPVIATDIRGCREVVIDGENGVLVPVRSARDIAAAIRRVGGDPETMRAMSQAGRERSKSHFDERTVVDTVMRSYADVARRKGLDLFPPGAEPVSYRAAVASDAPTLARLHMNGIHEGFLPKLGHRFMTRLYRAMVEWDGSVIQVAVDSTGPVGFVAGTTSTGAFYKHFIKTHGLTAGVVAAPSLVRNLGRAIETLRYDGGGVDVAAELLSMAVAGPLRGRGIGRRLGADFLDGMRAKDVEAVKVVVASHNAGAIAAYRSMGFVDHANIEVHEGESSEVLVWSI